MPNNEINLVLDGIKYEGWKEIRVTKSIENITTAFGFLTSDRYPDDPNRWPIKLGQPCSVNIGDIQIAKGYIEDIDVKYDAGSHTLNFSGRDITGDLVDCCHYHDGYVNEWKKQTILNIVKALCDPFDIPVEAASEVAADANYIVPTFKSNEGDKVFDLISKVCLKKAILPVSYGNGRLVLTRAGEGGRSNDNLQIGKNIIAGRSILSNLERYSDYIVKGQGVGNDDKELTSTVQPFGTTEDGVIVRHRPLVLLAESETTNKECEDRAKWESRIRMGKSRLYSYDVQGWLQSNGDPWPLNGLVRVEDQFMGLKEELLIAEILYKLSDEDGRKVSLTVADPTTYELLGDSIPDGKATKFDYKQGRQLTLYGPGKVEVINLGESATGDYETGGGF